MTLGFQQNLNDWRPYFPDGNFKNRTDIAIFFVSSVGSNCDKILLTAVIVVHHDLIMVIIL